MDEIITVGKLAVKAMGCNPGKRPDDGSPMPLCNVWGVADEIKIGEDKSGKVWSALIGNFMGKNLEDGKVYRSGKLFLPSGLHEVVESEVKKVNPDGKNPAAVRFGLQIAAVKAANPIGYSYQAKSLIAAASVDPLMEMAAQMEAGQVQPKQVEASKDENKKKK